MNLKKNGLAFIVLATLAAVAVGLVELSRTMADFGKPPASWEDIGPIEEIEADMARAPIRIMELGNRITGQRLTVIEGSNCYLPVDTREIEVYRRCGFEPQFNDAVCKLRFVPVQLPLDFILEEVFIIPLGPE